MTDLEKTIWRASRGTPAALSELFTKLLAEIDALHGECRALNSVCLVQHDRIEALEAKRGPGRPPKG